MRRGLRWLKLCVRKVGERRKERVKTRMALSALLLVTGLQMDAVANGDVWSSSTFGTTLNHKISWQQSEPAFKLTAPNTWLEFCSFLSYTHDCKAQIPYAMSVQCRTFSLPWREVLKCFIVMIFRHLYSLTRSTLDPLLFLNSFWSIVKFCEKH